MAKNKFGLASTTKYTALKFLATTYLFYKPC